MYVNSITPPHTYAEWVEILDMLKRKEDDNAVLNALHQGTIEWQSGVAERFAKKLIDVINFRIDNYKEALLERGIPDGEWLRTTLDEHKTAMCRQAWADLKVDVDRSALGEFYTYPTDYCVVHMLSNHKKVIVCGTTGEWSYIRANGVYGWVKSEFIK